MSVSNISGSKGRGAVASASYRSGENLYDIKEGRSYFYKRSVKPETFILKPKHAPEWCLDREKLWNEVERKENKINSRYAKEFNVALPIELNNDEQKKLLLDYVQNNFVDEGMVADIAIHRDHEANPHAHVMLTNRPFNQDGTWGNKSKHEYILDEKGNKTYTPAGNVRNRKIWLVDWDKREKIEEWRSNWADAINNSLRKKGLRERVSHKSYERQGIKKEPTIHVGVRKNKTRISYNETIKNKRNNSNNYNRIQRKVNLHEHNNLFKNNLSYQERHQISKLSKSLKTYVDFENIDDKRGMIECWKNSVLIKKIMGVDVTRQISLINKTELNIIEANHLLDKVAQRMMEKMYPQLIDKLSIYEKRELIQETINENKVYNSEELQEKIQEIREGLLDKRVVTLTRRPMVNLRLLQLWNNKNYDRLNELIGNNHVNIKELVKGMNTSSLENLSSVTKQEVGRLIKNIRVNNTIEKIINEQYKLVLKEAFPNIKLDRLDVASKELLYTYVMYYNPELKTYTDSDITQIIEKRKLKFTHEERKHGLEVLKGERKLESINNKHLKRVLKHQGLKQMFIYECREDDQLNQEEISQIRKSIIANESYLDKQRETNFEGYKPLNYGDLTANEYRRIVFSDVVINDLMREDYSKFERKHRNKEEQKLEKELTRKQGKNRKYNKNNNGPQI